MGIIGGIIGDIAGQGDRDQAKQNMEASVNDISNINVPDVESQKIALQKLVSAGQLTPELLQTIQQGSSQLNNISLDPRLKSAQMGALQSLQNIGTSGLSAADQLALQQTRDQSNRDNQMRNAAVLQNMQQRGQGGSGAELAAQLANAQSATQNQSNAGLQTAAMARQQALQAIMNAGQLGGQIGSQEFGQQAQVANAQDLINRFNAQNAQQVAQQNTGAQNQAQMYNLNNAQSLANQNTGLGNQQELHNKELIQQNFANQMNKGQVLSNKQQGLAGYLTGQAQNQAQMGSSIGQGIDTGVAGLFTGPVGSKLFGSKPSDNSGGE